MKKYLVLILIALIMLMQTEGYVHSESQTLSQAGHISPEIPVQSQPVGIAVNSNTSKIYVSNSLSNTVSVIDGLTNKVINNIDVGSFPTSLSINSHLNRIYVVNQVSRSISVIDGYTDKIKAEIKINSTPETVYVDPPSYYVITNDSLLTFVDPNVKPEKVLPYIGNSFHYGLTTARPSSIPILFANESYPTPRIYITNYNLNSVSVISLFNGSLAANIKVGHFPRGIVFNQQTNKIYVINELSNSISVIDASTNKVKYNVTLPRESGIFQIGIGVRGIALNPKTNIVYAAGTDAVYVIDGFTDKIKGPPISTGFGTNQISVDPDKNMIYVTNTNLNSESVISGETNKKVVAVNFKVNPQNAGEIFCRNASNPYYKISSNYPMYDVGTQHECEARANYGFGFSSWSSSNTTSNSTNPLKFTASGYGTSLAANFAAALSIDKYLGIMIAYFAILGPILALSAIMGWVVNMKRRNNLAEYAKKIDGIFDNASPGKKNDTLKLLQEIKDHIAEITIKGQDTSFNKLFNTLGYRPISESDYQLLNNKITEYVEKVRKM